MNTPTNLETILQHMTPEDRANNTRAIGQIAEAFEATTTVAVDIETIVGAGLPQLRDHVLSGGEIDLDLSGAIESLKGVSSISNKLIAAEVKAAHVATIKSDIEHLSPQARINYARNRGLNRPRADAESSLTPNEHQAILAGLNPSARIAYARRHGLV